MPTFIRQRTLRTQSEQLTIATASFFSTALFSLFASTQALAQFSLEDCAWKGGTACQQLQQETLRNAQSGRDLGSNSGSGSGTNSRPAPLSAADILSSGERQAVVSRAAISEVPVGRYPSQAALVAAARQGELFGYAQLQFDGPADRPDVAAVLDSIAGILATEYGTPVPDWFNRNRSGGGNSTLYCPISAVKYGMHSLLRTVTEAQTLSLSERPPNFFAVLSQTHQSDYRKKVDDELKQLQGNCSQRRMGRNEPLPFVANFAAILTAYSTATSDAVEALRSERVARYTQEQQVRTLERDQHAQHQAEQDQLRKAEARNTVSSLTERSASQRIASPPVANGADKGTRVGSRGSEQPICLAGVCLGDGLPQLVGLNWYPLKESAIQARHRNLRNVVGRREMDALESGVQASSSVKQQLLPRLSMSEFDGATLSLMQKADRVCVTHLLSGAVQLPNDESLSVDLSPVTVGAAVEYRVTRMTYHVKREESVARALIVRTQEEYPSICDMTNIKGMLACTERGKPTFSFSTSDFRPWQPMDNSRIRLVKLQFEANASEDAATRARLMRLPAGARMGCVAN